MVRPIVYVCTNTKYRESSKDTGLHRFLNTFPNLRNVFLRNRTADYRRLKLEGLLTVDIHWLEFNLTMSILSTSAGLLRILAVYVYRLSKCFLVSNLRCAYVRLYLELTEKSVNNNLQMKLAHSGNNRLACIRVSMSTECRVFLCKFGKRLAKFALRSLGLRLDCKLDNRLREFHGL